MTRVLCFWWHRHLSWIRLSILPIPRQMCLPRVLRSSWERLRACARPFLSQSTWSSSCLPKEMQLSSSSNNNNTLIQAAVHHHRRLQRRPARASLSLLKHASDPLDRFLTLACLRDPRQSLESSVRESLNSLARLYQRRLSSRHLPFHHQHHNSIRLCLTLKRHLRLARRSPTPLCLLLRWAVPSHDLLQAWASLPCLLEVLVLAVLAQGQQA